MTGSAFPHPLDGAGVTPPATLIAEPGQNVGHGHVFPRPDGVRARCGGPALCRTCSTDAAHKAAQEAQTAALLGALAAPWVRPLVAWLRAESDTLDFGGEEVPPRLRAVLDAVFRADEGPDGETVHGVLRRHLPGWDGSVVHLGQILGAVFGGR